MKAKARHTGLKNKIMTNDWLVAIQIADCEKVRILIDEGAKINSLDKYEQTALMNASRDGKSDLGRLLIDKGAKLNNTAKYKLTALMLAVINHHKDIVKFLIDAGADLQLKGSKPFAQTPLEYAVEHNNDEIVKILAKVSN